MLVIWPVPLWHIFIPQNNYMLHFKSVSIWPRMTFTFITKKKQCSCTHLVTVYTNFYTKIFINFQHPKLIIWAQLVEPEDSTIHSSFQGYMYVGSQEEDYLKAFTTYMLVMWPGLSTNPWRLLWNLAMISPVVSEERQWKGACLPEISLKAFRSGKLHTSEIYKKY